MGIKLGNGDISNVKLGSTQVQSIYLGTTKVWPEEFVSTLVVQYITDSIKRIVLTTETTTENPPYQVANITAKVTAFSCADPAAYVSVSNIPNQLDTLNQEETVNVNLVANPYQFFISLENWSYGDYVVIRFTVNSLSIDDLPSPNYVDVVFNIPLP